MSFSLPAMLACTFFYSALYLIYYYFAQSSHTLLIVSAIFFADFGMADYTLCL